MEVKCPQCGGELRLVTNYRMDFRLEFIPMCDACQIAHRSPNLGWKLVETKEDDV